MESFVETNNENNSSMLNNSIKNDLNRSFNKFLPQKPNEVRNQRANIDNKTHNSTKDTRNNAYSNINSSFQKTFSLFNESDSNSQTDRSSNNLKEIKINTEQKISNLINIQSINIAYVSEDKLSKIIYIQKCWKNYYKVIKIQKNIKGFLVRKNMAKIIYFIKSIFKLLFKLVINKIKQNIPIQQNKNDTISYNIFNTDLKKNHINNNINNINNTKNTNTNNKIKKIGTTGKFCKNTKINNHPSFNASNKLNIFKKKEESKKIGNKKNKKELEKKIGNNNPINVNLANKNKKIIKNKNDRNKEKDMSNISNIHSKDKLIANNIFNIYNNVKKYYENETNNISNNNTYLIDTNYSTANNFYPKNKKNSVSNKNNINKNMKLKNIVSRGSMKNINEKIIINKNNNINVNININNNPKTDRVNRYTSRNNKDKEVNSILYLLKLKKVFLFWSSIIIKRKIIQKLKFLKNIKTPYNIKKTLSIYSMNKKEQEKISTLKTKKVNISNSLMNLKKNKIIPQKLRMKNSNVKPNVISSNYSKKRNKHCNSVENNNSMMNLQEPKSSFNNSYNSDLENNLKQNKNNEYSENLFNNSVIVVSQFDRTHELKKDNTKKNVINNNSFNNIMNNGNINETKKLFYFYAIINLIDKHNKRKIIKKWFYLWKTLIRSSRSFINSKGIEEKIINFKNIKSPIKNNFNNINNNKFNKNNLLFQNNSSSNFNCQTEAGRDSIYIHGKSNSILFPGDMFTPNPIEKSMHPNLFKSNIKSNQIVYQKKLLVPKKMRNQSMHAININDGEDDRNMTVANNNQDMNYFNQTIGNNFYNVNTYVNTNNNLNNLNNSLCLIRRNNFDNINNKFQEGKINKINTIEETEIYFNLNQNNTLKNSFTLGQKNLKDVEGYNTNKINVNVVENYKKIEIQKDNNENDRYVSNNINNNKKGRITTKQINLADKNNKRLKNFSHSQEFRNVNQSY